MNTTLILIAFFICSSLLYPSEEKVVVKRDDNFLTDILDSLLALDANNQSTTSSSSTPLTFPTTKEMDSTTSSTTRYSSIPGATQSISTMSTTTGSGGTTQFISTMSTTTGSGSTTISTVHGTTSQTTTSAQETASSQTTAADKTTTTTIYRTTTAYKTTESTKPSQSSSSSSTTTSTSTATTTDNPSCHTKKSLSDVCNIQMPGILKNANIWDIYYMLFSDSIVESLLLNCPSGEWCLPDKFSEYTTEIIEKVEIISSSEAFSLACENTTLKCVQEATEAFQSCDLSPTINFTSDAMSLLCSVHDLSKVEGSCLEELLASFHVSIMNIVRRDFTKPDLNQDTVSVCDSTEAKMTKTYLCTRSMCPVLQDQLSLFKPWQWFLPDVSVIQSTCSIPADICQSKSIQSTTPIDDGAIFPSGTSTVLYDSSDEPFKSVDDADEDSSSRTIFIGVSAGVVFAVVVLFTIAVEFCRRVKKEESQKEGYKPLISKE